ncbi:hypothetical protein OESDEN_02456 [Oesophagostomum dentatum]|uniref:Uncharacterized protein n=1 Tax=Oesophagostomum dentatum TaxID=61180 RepID=A0A0B1TQA1_OESDE|nr:hypothetical protein OESDEN_02456 [Oesophagostomum dentatum]
MPLHCFFNSLWHSLMDVVAKAFRALKRAITRGDDYIISKYENTLLPEEMLDTSATEAILIDEPVRGGKSFRKETSTMNPSLESSRETERDTSFISHTL